MRQKLMICCGVFAAFLVAMPALSASLTSSGMVSWYGPGFEGRRTSSGCRFHAAALSAASPTLPLGMMLRLSRGAHAVIVQVIDRGPFVRHRVLDVSRAAAERLDFVRAGVVRVRIEALGVKPLRCG